MAQAWRWSEKEMSTVNYEYTNFITDLIATVGFPAALVFVLLFVIYKQNKKFTDAINRNTEAFHALATNMAILAERVKT